MPCEPIRGPGGMVGIVCTPRGRGRAKRCACGGMSSYLCDGPKRPANGQPRTCDEPICRRCAVRVGDDAHLCPSCHLAAVAERVDQ